MIDHANACRFLSVDVFTRHDQFVGFPVANQAFEALRRTVARNQSEIDFRCAEHGSRAGDSYVARAGHFTSASQGKTIDHGDGWFGQSPEGLYSIVGKLDANFFAPSAQEFGDVSTCHKRMWFRPFPLGGCVGLGSCDDEASNLIVGLDPRTGRLQVIHHFFVQSVEFVRAVDGEDSEPTKGAFIVNRVKIKKEHIAFWRVHDSTQEGNLHQPIAWVH